MSSTRTSSVSDPAHAPERNLSSSRLRGINVSLAIAAQAVRAYDPATRAAALWLANLAANSQRIQLCWHRRLLPDPLGTVGRITEVDLAEKLGLDRRDIYDVLTGGGEADLGQFRAAVEAFRAKLEAALPPLVKTRDTPKIEAAFIAAGDEHDIATVEGKWRAGKTEWCERMWLKRLHRAIWVHTPTDATEKSFLFALASSLGVGIGSGKKPAHLREQIKRALGIGLIDTLILDEAHNLWPTDLADSKPVRAEFVRELRDSLGVGSVLIVTDQFALSLEMAKENNTRWAPGQLLGRRRNFKLNDVHTDGEIRAIAKLHAAGPIDDSAVDGLLAFAKAEEGYLGAMVNAVKAARSEAGKDGTITALQVAEAVRALQTEQRIVDLAQATKPSKRRRRNVTIIGRAA